MIPPAQLIDLGAAADLRTGTNYRPDESILDPTYAAPEQARAGPKDRAASGRAAAQGCERVARTMQGHAPESMAVLARSGASSGRARAAAALAPGARAPQRGLRGGQRAPRASSTALSRLSARRAPGAQYCLPTDAPHLARHAAPLALAMSPLLWGRHKPDLFDSYSAGAPGPSAPPC